MTHNTARFASRIILAAGIALATSAAFSAQGFTLTPMQEKQVTVGMSRADVRGMLGRPSHNMKFANEPGRTWTYGVVGTGVADNTVFDVDFGADGKVMQVSERVEPITK
jgi:outer membrane protein assembly factor BamE (lipoprotein component of BamABCDE complex)